MQSSFIKNVAFVVSVLAIVFAVCMTTYAGEAEVIATGSIGPQATYKLYDNQTLVISGTGETYSYQDYLDGVNDYLSDFASVRRSVSNVTVENGITSIGEKLFNNTLIQTVSLPSSIIEIGPYAFGNCNYLYKINFPESLETIYEYAFNSCIGLSEITFPENLSSVGPGAFSHCSGINTVYYYSKNLNRVNADNNNSSIIGNASVKSFEVGPNVTYFPSFLVNASVSQCVFEGSIDDWCSISYGSTTDGTIIFCSPAARSKNLYLRNKETNEIQLVENIYVDCNKINNHAFYNNKSLKTVVLSSKVAQIGLSAFEYCTSLKSITVSSNLRDIRGFCFEENTCLDTINYVGTKNSWDTMIDSYGSSISSDEYGRIRDCKVYYSGYYVGSNLLGTYNEDKRELVISGTGDTFDFIEGHTDFDDICERVETLAFDCEPSKIGNNAFAGFTQLEEIVLPDTVSKIGNNAFSGCSNLKSINLNNISYIGASAFESCLNFEDIILCNEITHIGKNAFKGTKYASDPMNYTDHMLYLGENDQYLISWDNGYTVGSFSGNIPEGVTFIADNAFEGLSVSRINLTNSNEVSIGNNAFVNASVGEIDLPAIITATDKNVFNSSSIDKVIYKGTKKEWYTSIDANINKNTEMFFTLVSNDVEIVYTDSDFPSYVGNISIENYSDYNPDLSVGNINLDQAKVDVGSNFNIDYYTYFDGLNIYPSCKKYGRIQPEIGQTVTVKIKNENITRELSKMLGISESAFSKITITNGTVSPSNVIKQENFDNFRKKFLVWHYYGSEGYNGKYYKVYNIDNGISIKDGYLIFEVDHFSDFLVISENEAETSLIEMFIGDTEIIGNKSEDCEYIMSSGGVANIDKTGTLTALKAGKTSIEKRTTDGLMIGNYDICVYSPSISINGFKPSRTVDYKTTIKFSCINEKTRLPADVKIVWYKNGIVETTGETCTIVEAQTTYNIQVKLFDEEGKEIAASETELVEVKNGFFDKLVAVFKKIFKTLPSFEQK